MKVFVTGASGFIGSKLVPKIAALGYDVCSYGRTSSPPKTIEQYISSHQVGDVTNYEQTRAAARGCDLIFHLAGLVSYRNRDKARQFAVNVLGTRNVMNAALSVGARRVIHTSSVAAMGIPKKGEVGDESIVYNLEGKGFGYCDTKYAAEREVALAVDQGLNAVILNPGIVLGEDDTHPHHHMIFAALSRSKNVFLPSGGVTFSDIVDVVDAHVNAISRGISGERYALVSENLSFKDAALTFARVNNLSPNLIEIPGMVLIMGGLLAESVCNVMRVNPPLTYQNSRLSCHKIFFSSDKAKRDLGFIATPFEETICRTAPYYLSVLGQTAARMP